MLERYCDALIIGTEISGLITAAFLARRGLTVHVLDLDPFSKNDREPDPFCVSHLHSKLLRSILGRLNIPENDIHLLSMGEAPLQVIFPKKRITISPNPASFYEEIEREFPQLHEKVKSFYENLANIKHQVETQQLYSMILPSTFSERRNLKKFVKEHSLDNRLSDVDLPLDSDTDLKAFILSQLKLVTYTHVLPPFTSQVAELLNPSEGEILSMKGGHQFLKKLFLDRIDHHEGAYRPNAQIDKLLFKHGIFEGAQMAGLEGNILARYVIWNTDLKRLVDYLPNLWRFRSLKKSINQIKPSGYWFTSLYEVPTHFIPTPMSENLILIEDSAKDLSQANFLYAQVKKGDEMAKITVSYLLDPSYIDQPLEAFEPFHKKILAQLRELIPFAEDRIAHTFPLPQPTEAQDTLFPLDENDYEIFKQSAKSHPVFSHTAKSFTDLFPLSYKTPAPNLYLTSPEILGCMGYEGKFMLGLKVTDLIWQDVEKEKKRAMKVEKRIA